MKRFYYSTINREIYYRGPVAEKDSHTYQLLPLYKRDAHFTTYRLPCFQKVSLDSGICYNCAARAATVSCRRCGLCPTGCRPCSRKSLQAKQEEPICEDCKWVTCENCQVETFLPSLEHSSGCFQCLRCKSWFCSRCFHFKRGGKRSDFCIGCHQQGVCTCHPLRVTTSRMRQITTFRDDQTGRCQAWKQLLGRLHGTQRVQLCAAIDDGANYLLPPSILALIVSLVFSEGDQYLHS